MSRRPSCSRRAFLRVAAGASAFPAIIPSSAWGAGGQAAPSNRIAVGCIGVGPQGNGVMGGFLRHEEARVVAVCDVQTPRREEAKKRVDGHYGNSDCALYHDFREIVAREDIDAFLIASPDHWHVLHALAAVRHGKDVYLEKPMGLSLAEDLALRDAVHTHGRVFQFGTQQRSSREFRLACELVRNGRIGELQSIRVGAPASIARDLRPEAPVPDWLDYDLWLGPAPWSPYFEGRVQNEYWWHHSDCALGFVAGWGIHHVDIAQWGNNTDDTGPVTIEGGGVFAEDGFGDCAIGWDLTCCYANGVTMSYTDNTKNPQGVTFEGTEGRVYVRRGHIESEPEALLGRVIQPEEEHVYESNDHVGNFLDGVRTRAQAICDIDVAVRSDTICHISDIAMRLGRGVEWDPVAERFKNDAEANRMLTRAMREPWHL